MAQLGDLVRARALVRRAARAFGPREAVARARCIVAEAEIALVSRDLSWPAKTLDTARATLEAHGDRVNAAHARYLEVRRLLLIGHLDEAERALADLNPALFPPASRTAHELVVAGIAMRRLRTKAARAALAPCRTCSAPRTHPCADGGGRKRIAPPEYARGAPDCEGSGGIPSARRVEALVASNAFVVDACRLVVRHDRTVISLARRPVLFALARTLGEAWPGDVARDTLVARAFGSSSSMNRIAHACVSKSVGFAGCFGRLPPSARPTRIAIAPRRARVRRAGASDRGGEADGARLPGGW